MFDPKAPPGVQRQVNNAAQQANDGDHKQLPSEQGRRINQACAELPEELQPAKECQSQQQGGGKQDVDQYKAGARDRVGGCAFVSRQGDLRGEGLRDGVTMPGDVPDLAAGEPDF